MVYPKFGLFQSTLSVRRATKLAMFYVYRLLISIHALREESDLSSNNNTLMILYFNPRSPWGERQSPNNITTVLSFISIHALREESDCIFYHTQDDWLHFNPRSPWGERQCKTILPSITATFQSTLSVRRATQECRQLILNDYISIHALREESDKTLLFF